MLVFESGSTDTSTICLTPILNYVRVSSALHVHKRYIRPRREKRIEFLRSRGLDSFVLLLRSDLANGTMVHRACRPSEVRKDILIVAALSCQHRLDQRNFPFFKSISPSTPRHRPPAFPS